MNDRAVPAEVLGLKLPERLRAAMADGRWQGRLVSGSRLAQLIGTDRPDLWTLLDPESMLRETEATRRLARDPKLAPLYGLADVSDETAHERHGKYLLAADLVLMLMVNWDEEVVFLDYSIGRSDPRVVMSVWDGPHGERVSWLELAGDFETFADHAAL